jgi:predicted acetyltransferase
LDFIGVLPSERGQGFARQLCERGQADHPEAPAFLTTADPGNIAIYESWGFGICERAVIGGLSVVGMTREAQEAGNPRAPTRAHTGRRADGRAGSVSS